MFFLCVLKDLRNYSFKQLFKFFNEKYLTLPNKSGFKPSDSPKNELLSLTHDIYKIFDCSYKVRSVLLDILKAFDKGWNMLSYLN